MKDAIVKGIHLNMEQLVEVGEVANSVAMEKAGLETSLQYLLKGLSLHQLATDRHPQINNFMQKNHQSVQISKTYGMSLKKF